MHDGLPRKKLVIALSSMVALVLLTTAYIFLKNNLEKHTLSNTTEISNIISSQNDSNTTTSYSPLSAYNLNSQEELIVNTSSNPDFIRLPQGFKISIAAQNLNEVRYMVPYKQGILASINDKGKIIALLDNDSDGTFETVTDFLTGLNRPNGIDVLDGFIYIAESDKVIRATDSNNDYQADKDSIRKIVELPNGGNHFRRTVKIINNKMYISVGSTCNVCDESDELRATVLQCEIDGRECRVYASGLRNAAEILHYDNKIIVTDVGRDGLGDQLPPEELNILEEGGFYGWPYCYSRKIVDKTVTQDNNKCLDSKEPWVELPAHTTPLGLLPLDQTNFPDAYKNQILVSARGSWNATQPVGYKIYRVDPNTKKYYDFAIGWLSQQNTKLGRPVHLTNFKGGVLLSDDQEGKIYHITYSS